MQTNKALRHPVFAFAAACGGMLLFGITLITLGSVANELREKFQLDNYQSGTLFSILPLGILAGSFIFGPVGDRYGYKLLMIGAAAGMCAGFEGIAFAPDLITLKGSIFLFGLAGGIINGATNAIVADTSATHKGANLSLLGVFFGLGALGMPLVLGALDEIAEPLQVVAGVGVLTLVVAGLFAFVSFPPAKPAEASTPKAWRELLKPLMLLIAFFLFFQSSLEAIINNWTTTYLISRHIMTEANALYALSLHMAGMVVMRLLTGSLFRGIPQVRIMWVCLWLLAAGVLLMQVGASMATVVVGLVLSGAGLANGFPVMLGFVGDHYPKISGTAFSFAFVVALIGNMLLNYLTGIIFQRYGVQYLAACCYTEIALMMLLFYFTVHKLQQKK